MADVRRWLTVKVHTEIGLIEFRKALYKVFIQTNGNEIMPNYDSMDPMQISQELSTMQDHIVSFIADMVYDSMKEQGLLR